MVVSYTFTIESTGGNGIVVPGWGFLLNNELTDFNIDAPTHPNAPDGGKRPRSSMAPTYVEQGGRPFLAVGSPGGATIITTVLQILTERLDFGRTLRQGDRRPARQPAQPGAQRRRQLADGARAGVPEPVRSGAQRARAHVQRSRGDRRRHGRRAAARRRDARRGGAGAPRRRLGPGGQPVAKSASTGSAARTPSTTASASGQRLGGVRAGGDRDHAHPVCARARDVARGVADHDRALPRPAAGAGAGHRRQLGAALGVRAEAALAGREVVADAGARELAPRDRLEVAGHERQPVALGRARERLERVAHPGCDVLGQVRRAQLLVRADGGPDELARARVDRRVRDPRAAQQVARDRRVGAAGGLDLQAVDRDAVNGRGRAPQRRGVRAGRTQQQRAVDVPEQEERAQRRNERSASSFWANAAISFAVFSTSSSWTISTGECM